MAVATSAKANGTGSSATASASTGSISIAHGETILIFYSAMRTAGGFGANVGTISDTQSLTWAQINAGGWVFNNATNPRILIQAWFFRNTTGSMINTTVTVTNAAGGTQNAGIAAIGITGNSTAITNFGADTTNAAGDPAPSLAVAPAATSSVVGCGAFFGTNNPTAPTGFGQLDRFFTLSGTSRPMQTISDDSSPAQSATWSTTNTNSLGVLIEIPVPVASSSNFLAIF